MFTARFLIFSLCCVGLRSIEASSEHDPLRHYFAKDAHGLNLFDYNAYGDDPIDGGKPRVSKDETEPDENPSRAKQQEDAKELQEYFTGRKVKDDCPTFPFCNHIPAPRPFLPVPHLLKKPNLHVIYPWQSIDGHHENSGELKVKLSVEHAPHRQRLSVGQVNDRREHWVHPYGRFGGSEGNEDSPAMEQYQRKIYGHLMGKIADSDDVVNPGKLPDLSKTAESISKATHGAVNKASGIRQKDLGAGQLADAPPSSSEYIGVHVSGSSWNGRDPTTENEKKDKEKDIQEKVEKLMVEVRHNPKVLDRIQAEMKKKEEKVRAAQPKLGYTPPSISHTFLETSEELQTASPTKASPCDKACKLGPGKLLQAMRKRFSKVRERISLEELEISLKNFTINFPFEFDEDRKNFIGRLEIQLLDKLIPIAEKYKLVTNFEKLKKAILVQLEGVNSTVGSVPVDSNSTVGSVPVNSNSTVGSVPVDSNSTVGSVPVNSNSTVGSVPVNSNSTVGSVPEDGEKFDDLMTKELDDLTQKVNGNETELENGFGMDNRTAMNETKTHSKSFTKSEIEIFQRRLATFDKDGDKKISWPEMLALAPELGKNKLFKTVFLQHAGSDEKLNIREFWNIIKQSKVEPVEGANKYNRTDAEDATFAVVDVPKPEIYKHTHLSHLRGNKDRVL